MPVSICTNKLDKALRRERKHNKKVNGMRITGTSVKTIQKIQQERAEAIRRRKLQKEELQSQ